MSDEIPVECGLAKAMRVWPNWFKAEGNEKLATQRRQAAEAYPMIASLMPARQRLLQAIDKSMPLGDAIQASLGISKALTKRLAKLDWPLGDADPDRTLKLFDRIDPNWFPKNEQEWKCAIEVLSSCAILSDITRLPLASLLKDCGGKWVDFSKRMRKGIVWDGEKPEDLDNSRIRNASVDVADLVGDIADRIIIPLAANFAGERKPVVAPQIREKALQAAASIVCVKRNAAGLLEYSHKWHRERTDLVLTDDDGAPNDNTPGQLARRAKTERSWVGITGAVQHPETGLWLVPLLNEAELSDESNRMSHCVGRGGYSERCRNEGQQIISIRRFLGPQDQAMSHPRNDREMWESVATGQMGGVLDAHRSVRDLQFRARNNGNPSMEANAAYQWYIQGIKDGNIVGRFEAVKAFVHGFVKDKDQVEIGCGYNWKEPNWREPRRDRIKAAIEKWKDWLPSDANTLEKLIGHDDVRDVVAAFNPAAIEDLPEKTSGF
jgi:hypothetical protein